MIMLILHSHVVATSLQNLINLALKFYVNMALLFSAIVSHLWTHSLMEYYQGQQRSE